MLQQFFDGHFHIEKLTKYFSFLMCFFFKENSQISITDSLTTFN